MEKRCYRQFCGIARALDVVGERWTLLIARNLLLGPRRFGELLEELPGLTTNLLAKRLQEGCLAGLLERQGGAYVLSERGRALEPVLMELGRWGWALMDRPHPEDRVNLAWGLLSLKRRYAGGLEGLVVELEVSDQGRYFELAGGEGGLEVLERRPQRPHLRVTGEAASFRRLVFGEFPGDLKRRGPQAAWEAFRGAFDASARI